jgi:hypothetical protein
MSEQAEHMALTHFLKVAEGRLPALRFVKHTPNEANGGGKKIRTSYIKRDGSTGWKMTPLEAIRNSQMGVRAGAWDWELIGFNLSPIWGRPTAYFNGLAIEMKAGDNGLSPEQKIWEAHYQVNGWKTFVCHDWIIAAGILVLWVGGDPRDFSLDARGIQKVSV